MVRLGTPRSIPLAVQQWDSLIAVNYAAREYGISRMDSARAAKAKCPELITQHVATFREGEGGKWAYRPDVAGWRMRTDKVSLDPYRAESRKIIGTLKEAIQERAEGYKAVGLDTESGQHGEIGIVEKAGIDEVFVDLSAMVYWELMERYPELRAGPGGNSGNEELPPPPTTALEWSAADALVDLDENETEDDDPDWDDVAILIGSDIIRYIRNTIWVKLQYTCSGGIAKNKMMAKLGSARYKPNKQAVVRNRAVQHFLSGSKFTKIRMLGGKLGKKVSSLFQTEEIGPLLDVPIERLKYQLGDDTGTWLYGLIRGDDFSELTPRTQIKSMLATKSFRPGLNSAEQAEKWLRIFAAEIYNRLIEDSVLENKRRPKTITLHNRRNGQERSRQAPIPAGKPIDETVIFELGRTLLRQAISDKSAWPCANLALSVGAFEDAVVGNRTIEGYLVRGEEARLNTLSRNDNLTDHLTGDAPAVKKRKLDRSGGVPRSLKKSLFARVARTGTSDQVGQTHSPDNHNAEEGVVDAGESLQLTLDTPQEHESDSILEQQNDEEQPYTCPRCQKSIPNMQKNEHSDWHFAKDLECRGEGANREKSQDESQADAGFQRALSKARRRASSSMKPGKKNAGRDALPKGQKRLAFG